MRRALGRAWQSPVVRFLGIGGAAFVLDLGLLIVGRDVLHLELSLATALAFWLSLAFSFLMQRHFAFSSSAGFLTSAWRYGVLLAVNSAATVLIVAAFEALGPGYIVGKFAATALVTVWNFFAYRYWVFPAPAEAEPVAVTPSGTGSSPRAL